MYVNELENRYKKKTSGIGRNGTNREEKEVIRVKIKLIECAMLGEVE